MATRSKAWVCGRSLACVAGWNPPAARFLPLVSAVSGRSLCVGLITGPEETYRVCVCVCVCVSDYDREAWIMRGLLRNAGKKEIK